MLNDKPELQTLVPVVVVRKALASSLGQTSTKNDNAIVFVV